ncbi:MAG TPA: VTT domain-containing protein [Thermoanaerobaculia bacterium]|nr:VTT domain-containing protein [Thermoanaerobaculia bacterium]
MVRLVNLIIQYGVPLVFVNVLLEQLGIPVPAVPTLIVAGALSRENRMSSTHVLLASVAASLIADWIWFMLGRHYGYRILKTLCRISLSPDSCVRDTEAKFERWGLKSLLIAKFVPGFSTVAPPLAGAAKRSTIAFLIYDAIGALIWAGAAVAAGRAFHHAIGRVIEGLENLGGWAVAIVGAVIALFIFVKWAQRQNFYKQLRMARVSVHELKELIDRGINPLIVDARSESARNRDPRRIPTAIGLDNFDGMGPGREIIVYCT